MASSHRGVDDQSYFAADVGETRLLSANATSDVQFDAEAGPLTPGRWFVQALGATLLGTLWVGFGKFDLDVPLASPLGPGRQRIPLHAVATFEINVVAGYNDNAVVRTTAGVADVYFTRISRGV